MKIIAHRGYWENKDQQNTSEAILLGLVFSDGVEIDLRLYNNKIIISHDSMTNTSSILFLSQILLLSNEFPSKTWALNIKEDGLAPHLVQELKKFPELKYFCFDMSFPETVIYIKQKLKIASRISDLEEENIFISKHATFYVQDNFKHLKHIKTLYKKRIMLISPELHKRNFSEKKIKKMLNNDTHFLCTDKVADLC